MENLRNPHEITMKSPEKVTIHLPQIPSVPVKQLGLGHSLGPPRDACALVAQPHEWVCSRPRPGFGSDS